jgi:hypothetical protein
VFVGGIKGLRVQLGGGVACVLVSIRCSAALSSTPNLTAVYAFPRMF